MTGIVVLKGCGGRPQQSGAAREWGGSHMGRLIIGSVVAAVVMFMLGFLAYGSPLFSAAHQRVPAETELAVHDALKALPRTGTYFVPFADGSNADLVAAHEAGPIASIHLTKPGGPAMDPAIMVRGFVHMIVSAFLLGLVLWLLRDRVTDFGGRIRLVAAIALATTIYFNVGQAIWWPGGWTFRSYVAVADFVTLLAAGAVLARWFLPRTAS
jgi:hypothetical protein